MNELHRCYRILGLEPGASFIEIQERYKIVILAWHPDRFEKPKQKLHAEEEMKKINNARDKLKEHFEKGGHNFSGHCACKPDKAAGSTAGGGAKQSSGSSSYKKPDAAEEERKRRQKEEADAKRRDEERRKQREQDANSWAAEEQQTEEQFKKQADQETLRKHSEAIHGDLRRKIALAMIGLAVFLLFGSWIVRTIATNINNANYAGLSDEEIKLQQERDQLRKEKAKQYKALVGPPPTDAEVDAWQPPYPKPGTTDTTPPPNPGNTVSNPAMDALLAKRISLLHDRDEYFSKNQSTLHEGMVFDNRANDAGMQIGQLAEIVGVSARSEADDDLGWQRATVYNPEVYKMRNGYMSDIKHYKEQAAELSKQSANYNQMYLDANSKLQDVEYNLKTMGWTPPATPEPPSNVIDPPWSEPPPVVQVSPEFIKAQSERKQDLKYLDSLQGNMDSLRHRVITNDPRVRNQYYLDAQNYNEIARKYGIDPMPSTFPEQAPYDPNGL